MWILGALTLVGMAVGFVKVITEWRDQDEWGYTAAMVAFLFSAFGGAPLVAIAGNASEGRTGFVLLLDSPPYVRLSRSSAQSG